MRGAMSSEGKSTVLELEWWIHGRAGQLRLELESMCLKWMKMEQKNRALDKKGLNTSW